MEWDRPFGGSCTAFFGSPMGLPHCGVQRVQPGPRLECKISSQRTSAVYHLSGYRHLYLYDLHRTKRSPGNGTGAPWSDRLCAGGLSEFQTQPNGARLMIRVSGPEILEDVKTLLRIRMPVRGAGSKG